MLIKSADDKEPQIVALQELLGRRDLSEATRRKIDEEIWAIRSGTKTESDAAYEIEFQFGKSKTSMTIHDLRLEVDGRVAQIDHLIVTRILDVWVCESKSFTGGVAVNEHGEWSSYSGRRPHGIASPIEQNRRHIQVLQDVFAKRLVALPSRLGITLKPRFESLVLVSNSGVISRPRGRAARVDGIERVIKCEQLTATIDRSIDKRESVDMAKSMFNIVGGETVERIARELAALHTPVSFDWAAKFGIATADTSSTSGTAPLTPASIADGRSGRESNPALVAATVCQMCSAPVSEKVATFCRDNATRFGGRTLCYQCQRKRRQT